MMRRMTPAIVVAAGGLVVALAASGAAADEVYRSTNRQGRPVYGNVPVPGAVPTGIRSEGTTELVPAAQPATSPAPRLAPKDARELAEIEARLRAIETELTALARARTAHAAGSPATGGVGTNAASVRSPEEEALEAERVKLMRRAAELRGEGS